MKIQDARGHLREIVIGAGALIAVLAVYMFSGPTVYSGVTEVSMRDDGFSPAVIHVTRGTRVRFFNEGSFWHWPASDPHPTHDRYFGLDPLRGLAPHEAWVFAFDTIGAWGMHDHLDPSLRLRVVVVGDSE